MIIHVYFVSQVYRIYSRAMLTNFISLVSNLGGVYSLLIGMSVLSTIELFYFYTIRLFENYKMNKAEDSKPKTFSQRLEKVTITHLKVPRLNTAHSTFSDDSAMRMTSMSHIWIILTFRNFIAKQTIFQDFPFPRLMHSFNFFMTGLHVTSTSSWSAMKFWHFQH